MSNIKKYANYINTFTKIGLSKTDTLVYVTLLEHADMSPSDISKHTKLFRPSIYHSLEKLQEHGLVHITSKGKRVTYAAESPTKLEAVFKKVEKDFFSEIEDLHHLYDTNKNKLYVSVGSGPESIRDLYSDVVDKTAANDSYYRYNSINNKRTIDKYIPKDYQRIRDRKQIERYVITGSHNMLRKRLGRTVKAIPANEASFEDAMNLVIYADKVSIVDYDSESTITITHKKFAEMQKKIFKLLFDKL
jgi:sugar-specific transcriptional regulator TrmB